MPKKRFMREPGQPIPKEHLKHAATEDFEMMLGQYLMSGELSARFITEFNDMDAEAKMKAIECHWNLSQLWNLDLLLNLTDVADRIYSDFFIEYPEMARIIKLSVFG